MAKDVNSAERFRVLGIDPGTNYMGYGVVEVCKGRMSSVVMGVIDMHKMGDPYSKLQHIFERVGHVIDEYKPREVALEAPFFGENVQSMLKLGRAQGVAMAAALSRGIDVFEYAPTRVKQSVAGRGAATKEQLARMVGSILRMELPEDRYDATDAQAVAICHVMTLGSALNGQLDSARSKGLGGGRKSLSRGGSSSWEQFVKSNPDRTSGDTSAATAATRAATAAKKTKKI